VIKELKANDVNTITLVSAANGRYGKMRSTKRSRLLFPHPTRFQRSSRFRPAPIATIQRAEKTEA
jgi:hypothetical protein